MSEPDTDDSIFDCLASCQRLPGLDRFGTGGGVILQIEDLAQLVAAAAERWPGIGPLILRDTISSYLAGYVTGGKSWLLADVQREMMLQALRSLAGQGSPSAPIRAVKKGRRR